PSMLRPATQGRPQSTGVQRMSVHVPRQAPVPRFVPQAPAYAALSRPAVAPIPRPAVQAKLVWNKAINSRKIKVGDDLASAELKAIRASRSYQKLAPERQDIVEYWITSSKKVKYTSVTDLCNRAAEAEKNPDKEILKLMHEQNLLSYAEGLKQPSKKQKAAIGAQVTAFGEQHAITYSGVTLHTPTLPTGANPSGDISIASRTGREDGAFFRGTNTLPNPLSGTTSLANIELTNEMIALGNHSIRGGNQFALCPTCHKENALAYFEVDHQDCFADIRNKLHRYALAMSANSAFKKKVKAQLGAQFDELFVEDTHAVTGQEIFPTKHAMQVYSNDRTNLMAICRFCNGALNKSDQFFHDWFKKNSLYGDAFLNSLKLDSSSLIARTASGKGIGEAALAWFTTMHWPRIQRLLEFERTVEPTRQIFHQQTQAYVNWNTASDPADRKHWQAIDTNLGLTADTTVGVLKTTVEYQQNPKRYPYRPGSPARLTNQVEKVFSDRQEERRREEIAYQQGKAFGEGTGPQMSSFSSLQEQQLYNEGIASAKAEAQRALERGYADGIKGVGVNGSKAYNNGTQKGRQRLQECINRGTLDGQNGLPCHPVTRPGEPKEIYLKQAYSNAHATAIQARSAKLEQENAQLQQRLQQLQRLQQQPQSPFAPQPVQTQGGIAFGNPYSHPMPNLSQPQGSFAPFQFGQGASGGFMPFQQGGVQPPPVYTPQSQPGAFKPFSYNSHLS
ncbi:MAG TPA: hypothetical protein VK638_03905, partial [Edaphobacter sp.]|nr:hypothetical protein [Edaphobacter sp.]